MICPFSCQHCRYTDCPFWDDTRQGCGIALAVNEVLTLLTKGKPVAELTPKEQRILDLMIKGKSNQQISDALNISVSTVKNYVSFILRKLGAKSRLEAVVITLESNPNILQG